MNNVDDLYLRRVVSYALLPCFVLQHLGMNFHLSFGSLGLFLFVWCFRVKASTVNLASVAFCLSMIAGSFYWVLIRYGYTDEVGRLARYALCLVVLDQMLDKSIRLPLPTLRSLYLISAPICAFLAFQVLVDKSLQVPAQYFALGTNMSEAVNAADYEFHSAKIRGNGIYSEPSYFGMVACVLLAIALKSTSKMSVPLIMLLLVSIFMSGSGLGIFGAFAICVFALIGGASSMVKVVQRTFVGLIVFAVLYFLASLFYETGYDLSAVDRFSDAFSEGDGSTETRLVTPIFLVVESLKNLDVLGVPVRTFEHYMYTGLYSDRGDYPGHNGLWSALLQFGMFGVLIVFGMFSRLRSPIEVFMVALICSQNGNFLTYEKIFSILFTVCVLRSQEHAVDSRREKNWIRTVGAREGWL